MRKQSNTLNFEGQNIYVGIDVHKVIGFIKLFLSFTNLIILLALCYFASTLQT